MNKAELAKLDELIKPLVDRNDKMLNLSVNGTVNAKDLYQEAWAGRNFEIDHLWQRSVFLAVFMLAIAAGYGALILKIAFPDPQPYCSIQPSVPQWIPHLLAVGICYLGFVFSMLWVMMAKGSKYWYECYERAVNYFVEKCDLSENDSEKNPLFDIKSLKWCEEKEHQSKGTKSIGIPMHGYLPSPWNENPSLLSTKASHYSVSAVNCVIGIVGMICWIILNVIHGTLFFYAWTEKYFLAFSFSFLQAIIGFFFLYFLLKSFCDRK